MTVLELKEYIFDNKKIEFILSTLGCENIVYHENRDYFSASQPDGDNPQGINIQNNKYLNYTSYTRNVSFDDNKDLISLTEYIKKISFIDAVKYLHKILGLEYKYSKKSSKKPKEKFDLLEVFEKAMYKRKIDVSEIEALNEDLINDYIPLLHIDWFKEGIMPWTRDKFGLAYSYKYKRVIIPMRYWKTGELLGVNMRTTVENYEEFGIKKYFLTPSYKKSLNLFGLYENKEAIQKAGYVVVYESEKSVLKRDSLGDSTGVALSGHTMSDEQASILWGLNVDVIISMDKDVSIEEIRHMCSKLYRGRNVYYTYDEWDLLGEKDSIADKSSKIFNFMMKYKVKYDEKEHREYLKYLEKK